MELKALTEQEKTELITVVLKQLNATIKEFFPKDTVISTGLVINLIEITLGKIIKEEIKQQNNLQHEDTPLHKPGV